MAGGVGLADVLRAYSLGYFPMADGADAAEFYWVDPPLRGQLPIDRLRIARRLRRTVRAMPFTVRADTAFAAVIEGCAAPAAGRMQTWINEDIRALFIALHVAGFAHSVECWDGERLVGGVYGLALGGVFCGESMFSRATDASKIALVHLAARLWRGGFSVLDTQFVNPHLVQFGAYEIPAAQYRKVLAAGLRQPARFPVITGDREERALLEAYLAMNKALLCNNIA